MHINLSPEQQAIVTGDPGTAQDALHNAFAAVHLGSRDHIIAGGELYRIGPEPAPGQRFRLGFGGRGWIIIWPDGTEQRTRNLWHWGRTDRPDTAVLLQEPFWGNNLRVDGREHLLQPPPKHLGATYEAAFPHRNFFGILDERESIHVRLARERAAWEHTWRTNVFVRATRYHGGAWRHKVLARRLSETVRRFINERIVCLNCGHRPSGHWKIGDDFTGPVDWGCSHSHVDRKTGKTVDCDC
jgi:hypothetical protein